MKAKDFHFKTVKESPAEAEIASHKLLIRAGMIRKIGSGIYVLLPLGLLVLQKIEKIIREEMSSIEALEMLTPMVQPAEYWKESGRFEVMGQELMRIEDRHGRPFVLQPTSEEIFVETAKYELKSWKSLPKIWFQIQTKFRDERRPRFGLLRAREFIMKDAYSFDVDEISAQKTYERMFNAYENIFSRIGLNYKVVLADSGNIGGKISHEFHVLADAGEDELGFAEGSDFAANIELIPVNKKSSSKTNSALKDFSLRATPGVKTCAEVADFLEEDISNILKSLLLSVDIEGEQKFVMILLRADRRLNELKLKKLELFAGNWRFASEREIIACCGASSGFIGPKLSESNVITIADYETLEMSDFVIGANIDDKHFVGSNWGRDIKNPDIEADLRYAENGDDSPDGSGKISIKRGIEIGHTFLLGKKYSEAMDARFSTQDGTNKPYEMGCFGIGVSRILAAAVEQRNDEKGIVWPFSIAPFSVVLCPINYHKSSIVKDASDRLYAKIMAHNYSVLLDDRGERVGVMLAEWELVGIPIRVLISTKLVEANLLEVFCRQSLETHTVGVDKCIDFIRSMSKGM
ncbi:MAG: proline--tRNA ligase [Proteobacteria bacterium]|nr:proline--tRNA ligase [Pseudomonadota bacterium]